MKRFLVLYRAPTSSFDQMKKSATPEQQKAGRALASASFDSAFLPHVIEVVELMSIPGM
ncbi:MAG TPA: hypothetical protein VMI75_21765 [Polyangiaceae bacterium]|nr:hypothetical protein [Polyangiaceae bacterium]